MFKAIQDLCEFFGDEDYVQGPAGNISYKSEDKICIKRSGTCLRDKEFSWLNKDVFDNVGSQEEYDAKIHGASMESGMHSVLDTWVIHTHPYSLIPILCNPNCEDILKSVYTNIKYLYVPLTMPSFELFDYIRNSEKPMVIFLQNHGLVTHSNNCVLAREMHKEVISMSRFFGGQIKNEFNKEDKWLTPDHYLFRNSQSEWYLKMKKVYESILQQYNCQGLSKDFLQRLENLELEKLRVK